MRTRHTGHMRSQLMGRRQFSIHALALLGGVTIVVGCGGGSNSPTSPTATPPPGQNVGVVGSNHAMPHVAILSAAQLSAGVGISLEMSNGFHSHTVTLTGEQVTQIADKVRVMVLSSTHPHSNGAEPHEHTVTFN